MDGGVDGKEKERKRTERCSGQARDAWLESGQAHMRPPSHTHSQQKGFHTAAESTLQDCSTVHGAVKNHLKEHISTFHWQFCSTKKGCIYVAHTKILKKILLTDIILVIKCCTARGIGRYTAGLVVSSCFQSVC